MKRIMSYLCVALVFLFIQGCARKSPPPASTLTTYAQEKETSNPKLTKLVGKNYIKGIVRSLKQEANNAQLWNYEIDGIDTTNGKLSYVNFDHKSVLANEGDLVYASFDGMRMTEMFVVKEGFYKKGKTTTYTPPVKKKTSTSKSNDDGGAGKRDKAHQVIDVPKEETIRLN